MARAVYNGEIIAESEDIKNIDGNWYFPKKSINKKYLKESPTHLIRADKGKANFYNVYVDDQVSWNAAWHYSKPNKEINEIKDHIGFGPAIRIEK